MIVFASQLVLLPFLAVLQAQSTQQECRHLPASTAPAATANDNRSPAGSLRGGVLELQLVVQNATWRPEGDDGCGIGVFAVAEEGKPPQTPGPLIRVPVGTRLRVNVRNALDIPFTMRGLQDHVTTDLASFAGVEIPAGAVHSFEFDVTQPGTFFYYATPQMAPVGIVQAGEFSQAVGAFVVDPAEGGGSDRIFVMTRWRGAQRSLARTQGFELTAFNGRSWPHTERLTATVGDSLRWRVIAANNDFHFMHLHGFHFLVEGEGSLAYDSVYAPELRRLVVTEPLFAGRTLTIRWVPARAGNWIFHCHLVRHMSAAQRIDRMPEATFTDRLADPSHDSHAMHEMAGLVLGINVGPEGGQLERDQPAPRTLRLFANRRDNVFGTEPGYGFILQEGASPPAIDSVRLPGSLLLLREGEPTQITVTNRIGGSLAVHWHGLELDSYYDGVAGWSGSGERIAAPIASGDSFAVRITPPRAGTFIYHIHNEHGEELPSGLYGPLIVLGPGERYDPELNRLFVISEPGPGNEPLGTPRSLFVNGSATPDTLQLMAGRTYRFRIVSIPADAIYRLTLAMGGTVQEWRPVARDGADLPADSRRIEPATLTGIGAGMTFDFEYRPETPGNLTLRVATGANPANASATPPSTVVPIRVRPE